MKIGRKVGLLVGGLLLVEVATLGTSGGLLLQAQQEQNALMQSSVDDVAAANRLKDAYQAQNSDWDQMVINSKNPQQVFRLYNQLATNASEVESLTTDLSNAGNPALRAAVLDFIDMHRLITSTQLSNVPKVLRGNFTTESVLTARQQLALRAAAAPLQAVNQATQARLEAERSRERRFMTIFTGAAIALILGLSLLALLLTRRIVNPIRGMIEGAIETADRRLPQAVSRVRSMEGKVSAPQLQRFEGRTNDELDQLAVALNRMQDSAVDMAVDVRQAELRHAETLVNLGRRNQSMLTRTLSYVAELERSETDPDTLAKLFRLDHLTTRIRRNAESMLVLAGAQQSRMHARPVPVANLVRASLAEIEDYTRVTVQDLDPATMHGSAAADTAHLLAELLENATHFSPEDTRVTISGVRSGDGYLFTITDVGLGMNPQDLAAANARLARTGDQAVIEDTKILGHHIVARIASRRGIEVHLAPGTDRGLVATVSLPGTMLLAPRSGSTPGTPQLERAGNEAAQPNSAAEMAASQAEPPVEPRSSEVSRLGTSGSAVPRQEAGGTPEDPEHVVREDVSTEQAEVSGPVGAAPAARLQPPAPVDPAPAEPLQVRAETVVHPAPQPAQRSHDTTPRRRVRGANLGSLGAQLHGDTAAPQDANAVRAALSGLQGGVRNARNEIAITREASFETPGVVDPGMTRAHEEAQAFPSTRAEGPVHADRPFTSAPATSAPAHPAESVPSAPQRPQRRVRGAQLPDLGDGSEYSPSASRDAARVRSQMGGLQASVSRARREAASRLQGRSKLDDSSPATPEETP